MYTVTGHFHTGKGVARAAALAGLILVTAGVAGSTATQSATFRSAVDLSHGVHFNVISNPVHPFYGRFAFGQVGAGVFWASGATVASNTDGSIDVSFVGSGLRDAAASVDVYLGLHRYSGSEVAVPLDLSIHLDATDGSGTGRLIAGGVTYLVDPVVQPPSAAPEAQAVLGLIESMDWSGLYTHLLPATQQAMTQAEFIAAMNQGVGQNGSIVDVRPIGSLNEYDQGAWHAAAQTFEIDLEGGGQTFTRASGLALLFVGGQWRVYSIDQLAAPPPDTTPPTSAASPLQATYTSPTVQVAYTASDIGSGVDHVELWSRFRATPTDPWGTWTVGPTATASPITFAFGSDGFYEFYTIAVDGASNREAAPSVADAATQKIAPSGWSAGVPVNANDSLIQIAPVAAIDTNGTVHAAWINGWASSTEEIFYSQRNASTGAWSTPQLVNNVTTGDQFDPTIAVDGTGNAYAMWSDARVSDDRNISFSKRSASTGAWSSSVRVNDDPTNKKPEQRRPAIAVGPTGEAIAIWEDLRGNKDHIYAARLPAGGSTWSANMQVTSVSSTKRGTDIAIGPDGTAYAVWYEPASGDANIFFSTLAPGAAIWASPVKISDDPGSAFQADPQIVVDGTGRLLVVWSDWRTNPFQLRARIRPAGGSWQPSVVVTQTGVNQPSLAMRSNGTAYVAWYDGVNAIHPNVKGASYIPSTGAWSAIEQISDPISTEGNVVPAVTLSSSSIFVVYQHSHDLPGGGSETDIFAKTRSGP